MLQTLFMLFHRINFFTPPPPKNAWHIHTCIFPAETSSPFQTSRISRRCLDRARSLCTTKMSAITAGWLLMTGRWCKKNWKHQQRQSFAGVINTETLTSDSMEDKHNGNTQRGRPVGVYIFIYIFAIDAPKERGYGCGLYNFWSPGAKRLKGNGLHIQWNSS